MAKRLLPTMPHITLRSEAGNVREGFLEVGDFDPLLAELRQRDPIVADAVETAFVTLLRRSNLLLLTWAMFAIDVQGGHVCGGELRLPGTKTKNKRPLALPLTGRFLAVIDRRWQARREACPYVFHRAGRPVRRFDETWRAGTAAAGRPGLLLHDLRRSGARALLRAGVPEDVVMKLGGWRTRSMLTRYNVVSSDDLADAQERLTQAFATAAPRRVVPLRPPSRS
jgi:integrase